MLDRKTLTSNAAAGIPALVLLLGGVTAHAAQSPTFSAGGPDAAAYGQADHFPIGSPDTFWQKKYMVGAFSHFDLLFPAQSVAPAAQAWQFRRLETSPAISYTQQGRQFSLQDYLSHLPITGLLIAKDDQILFEAYQYGRTDRDRLTSQSMAKTIVGVLAGVAFSDQALTSPGDTAGKYLPELKGSPYANISIRDLLHMSSGVSCHAGQEPLENFDLRSLTQSCTQVAPAGTQFHYSAADSQVLGLILRRAVKMSLARYLDEKIWKNIGTEASAAWTIDASGQEQAFCCFDAALRDYARLARLLAFDGAWNGKQLIPRQWVLDGTTVKDSDVQLTPGQPSVFFGYGYQVWIFPGVRRMFGLLGANGQRIFVDPQSKLVMVQTAVMEKAVDRPADAEMIRLWMALVRRFGE